MSEPRPKSTTPLYPVICSSTLFRYVNNPNSPFMLNWRDLPATTSNQPVVEHLFHLFFNCDFSGTLWNNVLAWCGLERLVDKAPEEWILIFHLIKGKSLNKLMAQAAFAATVYWIWAERNKIMYGEDKYGHKQLFRLITRNVTIRMASLKGRFKDTDANKLAAKQLGRMELIRQPVVKFVKWEKPRNRWCKLNADGSLSSNNAGYGGLIRNEG
ncbi:hypothetical protein FRX31_021183 [Thalictrum thalictroides]|uniref:Reverse transcriptase zinc-binding domain-containing protein n=1 Tax=Thalictrum thalictroides TaxID=46969 RepID=A0A7J6VWL2_THATH|nr:hypothetical protein FRX31_021183 [Thalictrum thalictroides]